MSSIVVQKYGGACLATPDKMRAAASAVARLHAQGQRVVVIVSAMGKATDELVRLAYQVSPNPNRRELDMLLTTGERVSMALMSMALSDLGVPAISFTGSQAGVLTDGSHSQARVIDVRPTRVREELERGKVVVLAGFQGVNPVTKEITTLGRGGSDTTAVAMAAALMAARCEIIKDVDGVCTADPRLLSTSRPLRKLDFSSLAEMCFWGAKVLHFRSVELAGQKKVPLAIKRWGEDTHSTQIVSEVSNMESGQLLAVNSCENVEHIEIAAPDLNHAFEKLSTHLGAHHLVWPQVLASAFEGGRGRLMISGDREALDALIRTFHDGGEIRRIKATLSSVSVTCYGGVATDLANLILQKLKTKQILPEKILLSPQSVSVFIAQNQREPAVTLLHELIPAKSF